ncbi:MAG: hypothetical protein WCO00_13410 [Rhodospirillaceae bacterium]
MLHSGRAASTTPSHGGAKPPPPRPAAAGTGKVHQTPAVRPQAHGAAATHAARRSPIIDDIPEESGAGKTASWSLRLPRLRLPAPPSLRTVRRTALVVVTLLIICAAVATSVQMISQHLEVARQARIDAAIAVALDAHTRRHHDEGRSYEEISFTDNIRHCLGATLAQPGYALGHRLEGDDGGALLGVAEAGCLRAKVRELMAMPRPDEVAGSEERPWREARIRAMLVFAREHGYRFPPDLMAYERPHVGAISSPQGRLP